MPTPQRNSRRTDALSRERIVAAAVDLLDADDETNLTFRALSGRLSTGAGAIYHHVANKQELLTAATDQVVAELLEHVEAAEDPTETLREISLNLFDAIDAHPWVGRQLSQHPLPAVLRIWTAVGHALQALGVDGPALSDAGSTLVNYVLGAAAQNAAGPRTQPSAADREAYLATLADRLHSYGPDPLVDTIADEVRAHDDRAQFLTGVDIVLAGITARCLDNMECRSVRSER